MDGVEHPDPDHRLLMARAAVAILLEERKGELLSLLAEMDVHGIETVEVRADPLTEGVRVLLGEAGAVPVEVEF